jgi:hypothetical protein
MDEIILEEEHKFAQASSWKRNTEATMRRSEWKQWAGEDGVAKMEEGGTTATRRKACLAGGGVASGGDGGERTIGRGSVAFFYRERVQESIPGLYTATINTNSEGSKTSILSYHPCRPSNIQRTKLF